MLKEYDMLFQTNFWLEFINDCEPLLFCTSEGFQHHGELREGLYSHMLVCVCVFACSAECFKCDYFDLCLNNFKHYYHHIISAEWMDGSTSYMQHLRCLFAFSDVSHSGDKNETLDST